MNAMMKRDNRRAVEALKAAALAGQVEGLTKRECARLAEAAAKALGEHPGQPGSNAWR